MIKRAGSLSLVFLLGACIDSSVTEPAVRAPTHSLGLAAPPVIVGFTGSGPNEVDGINNSGTMVGCVNGRASLMEPGQPWHTLDGLPDGESCGESINDNGQVTGYFISDYKARAFLWSEGIFQDITPESARNFSPASINSARQIVGTRDSVTFEMIDDDGSRFVIDYYPIAAIWENGQLRDLSISPSRVARINDAGQAVGIVGTIAITYQGGAVMAPPEHAVLWENGTEVNLGYLPGGSGHSEAYDINQYRQVVGSSSSAAGSAHAFLWQNGTMRDLGTLGGSTSVALEIDDEGRVFGWSFLAGDLERHAFIWTMSDGMEDLTSVLGDITLFGQHTITNNLQIVGRGPGGVGLYQIPFTPTPNTPVGTEVTVSPLDNSTGVPAPIQLTFDDVNSAGLTTVRSSIIGISESPPAPSGFQLGSPATFYNIASQATFAGSVTLCIDYSGISYGNESELRLLHYSGGTWTDITSAGYPNPTSKQICGVTTSFSPFLIAELNVAPVVNSITLPGAPTAIGSLASLSASFGDLNPRDSHTAVVNWSDGSSSAATVTESAGSGTAVGTHSYAVAGVYTIRVSVTDGNLTGSRTSAADVPAYIVAYDPNGGFVTGGGWITSPIGAYAANGGLTGKATFGFVSKYSNGKTVPTGNTEFMFTVGQLKFTSTSYDWLVISGARAQYKGLGSINESGSYRFILTAIDEDHNGGGGVDKFRLKIWNDVSGELVYDNQKGSSDSADPVTALGGGSIVIHK